MTLKTADAEAIQIKGPQREENRRGGEKERFQQSASTHSGMGEKETLNIDVVGKSKSILNILKPSIKTNMLERYAKRFSGWPGGLFRFPSSVPLVPLHGLFVYSFPLPSSPFVRLSIYLVIWGGGELIRLLFPFTLSRLPFSVYRCFLFNCGARE